MNCGYRCTSCEAKTGSCTNCESPYTLSNGKCGCPSGYADSGVTCVDESTLLGCEIGFYNDGSDNCIKCGAGCSECSHFSGNCTVCQAASWFVSTEDPQQCN